VALHSRRDPIGKPWNREMESAVKQEEAR